MKVPCNRSDWTVLALAIAVVPFLFAQLWTSGEREIVVELYRPGHEVQRLALAGERTVRIAGALGESVIEFDGAGVRFAHSPCRAKRCVLAGWLRTAGAAAACVPNQVALALVADGPAVDAINY